MAHPVPQELPIHGSHREPYSRELTEEIRVMAEAGTPPTSPSPPRRRLVEMLARLMRPTR
jgi:hypothetical protein